MNDLNTLLDRAAGPATTPVDAGADLTRAHRALSRTRRRRAAAGLVGAAAIGAIGVGASRITDRDQTAPQTAEDTTTDRGGSGVHLLAQPLAAGDYTFDSTPEGWEVQGAYSAGVTIAPVGFPDQEPLSFIGKLVIGYDQNPIGTGEQVDLDGRTLVIREGEGYTTISAATRPGEPAGVIRIQYPSDTGWTRETMLEFLAGVHLGPGAQPGVG